jgi:catechol 2,3-dioxygenase-like lactoylglutathione lyase family enzyme
VALKVADLEAATQFYENVFGFRQVGTGRSRGHISRHSTDGYVDLALMVYDSEEDEEAKLVGPGPAIHHFGIEVEDRRKLLRRSRPMAAPLSRRQTPAQSSSARSTERSPRSSIPAGTRNSKSCDHVGSVLGSAGGRPQSAGSANSGRLPPGSLTQNVFDERPMAGADPHHSIKPYSALSTKSLSAPDSAPQTSPLRPASCRTLA